ncbi:MAG: hypothetical protein PUD26_09425, partial [bacterium]|nr:hypothetical protein [bacterium]
PSCVASRKWLKRHHLDGDAVIRQLRCGYLAALPRLEGITLAVMRLIQRLRRGYRQPKNKGEGRESSRLEK